MGVWIETFKVISLQYKNQVAPYVGVWIETIYFTGEIKQVKVAPYVGVWIETYIAFFSTGISKSHPMWVCGLKHGCGSLMMTNAASHPMWVCGLKLS